MDEARRTVEAVVYCTASTVGPDGRPRSRVVHPVWDWSEDVPRGWVTSRPTPLKQRHLAATPVMTCSYWSPAHDVVTFDCDGRWLDEGEQAEAWARIAATPAPVGFDPATIWPAGASDPTFAVIELAPYRIVSRTAAGMAAGDRPRLWAR